MLDTTLEAIKESHKNGNWMDVMLLNNNSGSNFLLWPKPHIVDLKFIYENLKEMGLDKITSIGSGTGLLEWLLQTVTGIKVICVEIDKAYWTSKTRRYNFCSLTFPDDKNFIDNVTSPEYALLFCYFNNGEAFTEYLENYQGNLLIIIGSGTTGIYTNPMPYDPCIPSDWKLHNERIMSGGDIITMYTRR